MPTELIFEIADDDPMAEDHRQVDAWLDDAYGQITDWSADGPAERQTPPGPETPEVRAFLALPSERRTAVFRALVERLGWLDDSMNHPHMDGPRLRRFRLFMTLLGTMVEAFLEPMPSLEPAVIVEVAGLGARTPRFPKLEILVRAVVHHVGDHGESDDVREAAARFHRSLCEEALQGWQPELWRLASELQAIAQVDPEIPLAKDDHWADRARADLRSLGKREGRQAALAWIDALQHAVKVSPDRPGRSWREASRPKIDAIGASAFSERLSRWFALTSRVSASHRHPDPRPTPNNLQVLFGLAWMLVDVDDPRAASALEKLSTTAFRDNRDLHARFRRTCSEILAEMPGEHGQAELAKLGVTARGPLQIAPALLVASGRGTSDRSVEDRVGGLPVAPAGTQWPACSSCHGSMQFLAQLDLSNLGPKELQNRRLLLFQCRNRPGQCSEWDPDSGGNRAMLVVVDGASALTAPGGPTTLDGVVSLRQDRTAEEPDGELLGTLGGRPEWIQSDETPHCCDAPMFFLASLDSNDDLGMSFGDLGRGYAFVCRGCHSAKFLWQS